MIEVPDPRTDGETLREIVDDELELDRTIGRIRTALREPDDPDDATEELYHRGMLTALLRISGRLDDARDEGDTGLERALAVGLPAQQQTARIRLAHVTQWQQDYAAADALFAEVLAHAGEFGPIMAGYAYHHAGLNDYDQQRYAEAAQHFRQALDARRSIEAPQEQVESSVQALVAAERRLRAGS